MEKVNDLNSPLLIEAVVTWTGWGQTPKPRRMDSCVADRFGAEAAAILLPIVKSLEEEFYSSDAKNVAADIQEMERLSAEQFRRKHPEIGDEIVNAFSWCYTYDFK